jgi:hypothetical protein
MADNEAVPLVPDPAYAAPASVARIGGVARALEANGIRAVVAADRAAAREEILRRIPDGSRVFTATSATITELGIPEALAAAGRVDLLRARIATLDPVTQRAEIRRTIQSAEIVLGSVHAVTEEGTVLVASATGSQLALYADSAVRVLWAIGAQKIVSDEAEGFRRIERRAYPLEDARARTAYGRPSHINKVLVVRGEPVPDRITAVLLREAIGF